MTKADEKRPVAVVTGGAGEIGSAIAKALGTSHRIALVDINRAALDETVSRFAQNGIEARGFQTDLLDHQAIEQMGKDVSAWGTVKILVNNAGAGMAYSYQDMTSDSLDRDLRLNLKAALACFKAFEADLKDGGNVINIASVNGLGTYGHPAYSAAKAGLIHATRQLAVEYGKFGLRANTIAPGTVRTQAWVDRTSVNPNVFDEALTWYPLKQLPTPEDIAQAVTFLTSPHAQCITGICLPIDSGLTCGSPALPRTFTQSADF